MSTIRVEHRERFAVIANAALEDERLSFRARGLLAYLLAKPDGWRVRSDRLAAVTTEGRDAIRTALAELERAGYLTRTTTRDAAGHWVHEAVVREVPEATGAWESGAGSPADGFPGPLVNTQNKNYPPTPAERGPKDTPRARRTNPRAQGTNPRARAEAELEAERRRAALEGLAHNATAVVYAARPHLDPGALGIEADRLVAELGAMSLAALVELLEEWAQADGAPL